MSEANKPAKPAARRRFLQKAAAGTVGAGALAAPMISKARDGEPALPVDWPSKDIFHEYALDFAKKVDDMAGNRLKIEVLPAGAVVPPFQPGSKVSPRERSTAATASSPTTTENNRLERRVGRVRVDSSVIRTGAELKRSGDPRRQTATAAIPRSYAPGPN